MQRQHNQVRKEFHGTKEYIVILSKVIEDHRLRVQLVENINIDKIEEKMASVYTLPLFTLI